MTFRVLWPRTFGRDHAVELEAMGEGFTAEFCRGIDDVTDTQWRTCDAIVGVPPPAKYLDKLERCRIFVKTAVGYDDMDLALWGAHGIPVCNTPDYGTREVADHAIALMLTLARSVAFHDESLREDPVRNWRPALNPFGRRLSDCTFGVIGLGRIGLAVARRAAAFEMDVAFHDPFMPNGAGPSLGVRRVQTLTQLLAESDIASLHIPLNDDTLNLLDANAFAAAKPGITLINTARGPLIDLNALHDAMRRNLVLAAGLDVLPDEPPNLDAPLIQAWRRNEAWIKHRLLITPHSAFFTPESVRDIRAFSARTAARYLRDGRLENCVNEGYLTHRR